MAFHRNTPTAFCLYKLNLHETMDPIQSVHLTALQLTR